MTMKKLQGKKNKNIVISTRLTDDEYADIQLRIADENLKKIISLSEYFKQALLGASVHVIDKEVEQYRVHILGKISNNINQISRRLNFDNLEKKINDDTYKNVLIEMKKICDQVAELSAPLR